MKGEATNKKRLVARLNAIVNSVNQYLAGKHHEQIAEHLRQFEPKNALPKWLKHIEEHGRPAKTDSKSLGTIIEKFIKAEISRMLTLTVSGSSASGVDIPELDLNLKTTSDRQPQSSEPFVSAYQRILGADHDVLVCIYNGEEFHEQHVPLKIIRHRFLRQTQAADKVLCSGAQPLQRRARSDEASSKIWRRCLRALAYTKKSSSSKLPFPAYFEQLRVAINQGDVAEITAALEKSEQAIFKDVEPPLQPSTVASILSFSTGRRNRYFLCPPMAISIPRISSVAELLDAALSPAPSAGACFGLFKSRAQSGCHQCTPSRSARAT
jgi:hypothetical protein